MRSIMLLAALLAVTPAMAQDAANLDLARRLVHDQGGFAPLIQSGGTNPAVVSRLKSPEIYAKAYAEALAERPNLISQADERMAEIFARIYTAQELNDWITFEESPDGQSLAAKARAAIIGGPSKAVPLTDAEKAAQDKFAASPSGKAIQAKGREVQQQMYPAIAPLMQDIQSAAEQRYCKEGGDCSNPAPQGGASAPPPPPPPQQQN